MARSRPTVPTGGGYMHREHRSKGGRRKIVIGEDKIATYFVRAETDNEILEKNERQFEVKQVEFKEKLLLEDILDLPKEPVKTTTKYPKLVCENCGYQNRLQFHPKKEELKLLGVVCEKCHELAHSSFYWKERQLQSHFFFLSQCYVREWIKTGRITLLNLLNLW